MRIPGGTSIYMFYVLVYIQFALVFLSFILSPIIILTSKKSYKFFGLLLFELSLAQLFMYEPGADVSPYMFSIGELSSINIGGLTLASITSIAIDWFVVCYILIQRRKIEKSNVMMFFLVLIPNVIALLKNFSFGSELADFIKILSPFIIYIYIGKVLKAYNVKWFSKLLTSINLMLICQVFICKIVYGSFSAHNYYYEIAEETFGFYNHPHAFTGVLAFFVLWNVYKINKKENVKLNILLAIISVLFMWFSGVRTYILALAAGLAFIGWKAISSSEMKYIKKYVYLALVLIIVFGPFIISSFGATRDNSNLSSDRLMRWTYDLSYMFNSSLSTILAGGGMRYIEKISSTFVGWEINSLNLFIDNFANYGLIGVVLISTSYYLLFKKSFIKDANGFQIGIFITFLVASCINSVTVYILIMIIIVMMLSIIKEESRYQI